MEVIADIRTREDPKVVNIRHLCDMRYPDPTLAREVLRRGTQPK